MNCVSNTCCKDAPLYLSSASVSSDLKALHKYVIIIITFACCPGIAWNLKGLITTTLLQKAKHIVCVAQNCQLDHLLWDSSSNSLCWDSWEFKSSVFSLSSSFSIFSATAAHPLASYSLAQQLLFGSVALTHRCQYKQQINIFVQLLLICPITYSKPWQHV